MKKLTNIALLFCFTLLSYTADAACMYEQNINGENLQIGNMITWSTNFEENTSVFLIEKSADGVDFVNVGTVKGAGESEDLKSYNYLDVMSDTDRSFYRLRQVDADGSFSFSEIVTIQTTYKNNFMVARMSNVTTNNVFDVTIDAFKSGNMTYTLSTWRGEEVVVDNIEMVNGLNDLTVDLEDQNEGIYKLKLAMDGEVEILTIKKLFDEITKKPNVASKNKKSNKSN